MKLNKTLLKLAIIIPLLIFSTYLYKYKGYYPSVLFIYNLLFFYFFIRLNIYLHELGHVLFGSLAGIGIYSVQIGNGNVIWHRKIFNIIFEQTDNFRGGFTLCSNVPATGRKLKLWILTAGGLLLQLMLTLIVGGIFGFSVYDFLGQNGVSVSSSFVMANIPMIVLTIIPKSITLYGYKIFNDGAKLFKIPFLEKKEMDNLILLDAIFEAHKYFEAKEYGKAEEHYKKLLHEPELSSEKTNINISLSLIYIKQLRIEEAIIALEKYENEENDYLEAIRLNNLAWIYLLKGGDNELAKALEYAQASMDLHSEINSIKSTMACVLIESGRVEDGISLLKQTVNAKRKPDRKINISINMIYLAYAYNLLGKKKEADKILEKVDEKSDLLELDDGLLYERIMAKIKESAVNNRENSI